MTDLVLPDDLAERLQRLAERQNRSVVDVIASLLDETQSIEEDRPLVDDPLLRIWEMAEEANLEFTGQRVSERTKEILNVEYTDYLLKRMRGDDAED